MQFKLKRLVLGLLLILVFVSLAFSTNLLLDTADIEILNDDMSHEAGSTDTLYFVDDDNTPSLYYGWIMFNISDIPASQQIDDAELCFWVYTTGDNADADDIAQIYSVISNDWNEEDGGDYSSEGMDYLVTGTLQDNFTDPTENAWMCFNVTSWVSSEYSDGDNNVSFGTWLIDGSADADFDYVQVGSKEFGTAAQRPFLNITYSEAPSDTCSCPGVDTNWEIDLEDYCELATCDLGTGNITWTNTGNATCDVEINASNLEPLPSGGILWAKSSCRLYVG